MMHVRNEDAVTFGFVYHFELMEEGRLVSEWYEHNLVPLAGLNYMAQAMFGDTSPIGTFYVGLFENNYLPASGALASDLPGVIGEFVGYSEAVRPLWNRVNTNGLITNAASRAVFTSNQNKRLYGGFLVSSSEKGGNTGMLLSVARFNSPKDVEAGQVLRVRAELSLIPTNVV
ncbi:hypothetical protein FBY21_1548 [Pseudomonas sp. SLBN-26]|uniref:hypothetical protein n=1 Tax=Pseudomonadaceae TaxID=135621 RepID=UPI0011534B63|nr:MULTISPECIES: hypothetical protein [Pseudomonas]MCP1616949.1 hypothetical protein [Pseudomonas otitidis]TQL06194.1 hypothetical protein FBY21_1548 [Pseudomonas sp. SLBN-26]